MVRASVIIASTVTSVPLLLAIKTTTGERVNFCNRLGYILVLVLSVRTILILNGGKTTT